ncbi:hypothetical protein C8R44DRAFT_808932 [Mycena epipterygia]|nr:hypothetical protein C8R44DRAFT_808932 [Mycena epipterygia]
MATQLPFAQLALVGAVPLVLASSAPPEIYFFANHAALSVIACPTRCGVVRVNQIEDFPTHSNDVLEVPPVVEFFGTKFRGSNNVPDLRERDTHLAQNIVIGSDRRKQISQQLIDLHEI